MSATVPIFRKLMLPLHVFVNDCTEFHENHADVFVIDCMPQTDRQTDRRVLHTPCFFTL